MSGLPLMNNFKTRMTDDGILHLSFDMPDRSLNVFSNEAIHEIDAFATWLKGADVAGVVISSGKTTAFCAGADLTELAHAYEMIMAAPKETRDALTIEHFSPIGRAFRKLETAGKPVAVAVHGLALGGGCELFLACHYRIVTDAKETQIGLPESLVGLLPGGGGTQRMPRFIGATQSLGVLLEGARLDANQAVALGAANEVVAPGQELAAAEAWVRSKPDPRQPWDREDWQPLTKNDVLAVTKPAREDFLRKSGGHYPAELAILDCLDNGLPLDMNGGIAAEVNSFKDLVQRVEPRNMIAVKFLGRVEYDKRKRKNTLPDGLEEFAAQVKAAMDAKAASLGETGAAAQRFACIASTAPADLETARKAAAQQPQWFEAPASDVEKAAFAILAAGAVIAADKQDSFAAEDRNLLDLHCQQVAGFPAYLGGPFTFLARYGAARSRTAAA